MCNYQSRELGISYNISLLIIISQNTIYLFIAGEACYQEMYLQNRNEQIHRSKNVSFA